MRTGSFIPTTLILSRRLDRIRVVGINEPVRIHEILETKEDASPVLHECVNLFHKALDFFESRNWPEAEKIFNHTLELSPGDGPSLLYLERCRRFRENPPDNDWDGIFDMDEK